MRTRSPSSLLRAGLAWAVAGTVALSPVMETRAFAAAPPSDADMTAAREAYKEGEKAYRLGRFDEAASHFEQAYELSALPDILYNIGLSHMRWYDIDPDLAHLRQAKVVFTNYQIELQKNPELGDASEVDKLLQQIDEKMAAHEEADARRDDSPGPVAPVEAGDDPGKKLRLAGAVSLGVGGVALVGGVVGAALMGVRGQEFQEQLQVEYDTISANDCDDPSDPREVCQDAYAARDTLRSNGRQANVLAVGLGISLGGIGVIGLAAGTILFLQGNKRTKEWNARSLGVAPMWSPDGTTGLSLSGKF
ncbi:hypothetical protein PPSIR1_01267 [Plesiocystis pacifica SIR-1]|uniref:Tetratricopeptide repeat protein n=1 Tax=Plesiocystis pacifica SIR-1 TaxID=391625 RepID=A6GHX8_9BACT|nr:tetratricopeptide repeat protein [Plesiocystis pacifica]EDM74532.1 hypothetical protein PPSIR1_01267 [Plesiocystis pacifica SIR-1]